MKKENKTCSQYCGYTCINGHCPNALNQMDAESDTDEYASYRLDKPIKCSECSYNNGCEDCYFYETPICNKYKNKDGINQ